MADAAVRDVLKLGLRTEFSVESRVASRFSAELTLANLGALDPRAIDPGVVARDCAILSEIVEQWPDRPAAMIEALTEGTPKASQRAAGLAEEAGPTEAAFVERGGGCSS